MKTAFRRIALLLMLLMGFASPAKARTRPGIPVRGVIQRVDAKSKEVAMLPEDREPIKFTWGSRTTFIANGQAVDAAILKPGTRVEVIYYKPFFREASVSKVTLFPNTRPDKRTK